jgi:hypothetical protein
MWDSQTEFELALSQGRLSKDRTASNYVGDYMFMGYNQSGQANFKHINSRKYLPALASVTA